MLTAHLLHTVQGFLEAPPTPTPTTPAPTNTSINTDGIKSAFLFQVAPLLFMVLGIIFLARANRGEVSKVLTSSAIAIIGVVFMVGSAGMLLFGDSIAKLLFH